VIVLTPDQDGQATLDALPAGETVRITAGRHAGPWTVHRPVTLLGEAGATLVGNGHGTVLTVLADDVAVRDLHVRGGGHDPSTGDAGIWLRGDRPWLEGVVVEDTLGGIDLAGVDGGVVRGCTIRGRPVAGLGLRGDGIRLWEATGNRVEDNELSGVRDLVVWYADGNVIARNVVRDSRYGTHLMHADDNDVRDNRYEDDVVGVFVMYSEGIVVQGNTVLRADGPAGMGVGLKESNAVRVLDNRIIQSTTGIYLDATPHRIDGEARISGNLLAYDHVGVRVHAAAGPATIEGNRFHEADAALKVDDRVDIGRFQLRGNRWSDYAGYDLDGDGVGDLPHLVRGAGAGLLDRSPALGFWQGTPAAMIVDLFSRAFPLFAAPVVATDPSPVLG
jgi:nitrous oxidase accessory protein